jgi:hypothetical protein
MTDLPPKATDWSLATIRLTRDGSGELTGVLLIGGVPWHVRNWVKGATVGIMEFEVQPISDEAFEAMADRLGRGLSG